MFCLYVQCQQPADDAAAAAERQAALQCAEAAVQQREQALAAKEKELSKVGRAWGRMGVVPPYRQASLLCQWGRLALESKGSDTHANCAMEQKKARQRTAGGLAPT